MQGAGSVLRAVERELFFCSNIDAGEPLTVVLCAERREAGLSHWCQVVRDGDGLTMVDVFTTFLPVHAKRAANSCRTRRQQLQPFPVVEAGGR